MRKLIAVLLTIICLQGLSVKASAEQVAVPGVFPFGFYQPYGVSYGNSIRTPPYFATNPPVYYGARYTRPYGLSPFAAPPQLTSPAEYHGKVDTTTTEVQLPESASQKTTVASLRGNQAVNATAADDRWVGGIGPVRSNPFASTSKVLVKQ